MAACLQDRRRHDFEATTFTIAGVEDGALAIAVRDHFLNPPANLANQKAVYQFK